MNTVPTLSDTKRAFYSIHTRPVNSIYRRVIEELMVEMHLLEVNVNFTYDPIYALGVVTSFYRFMEGYRPEEDQDRIFDALCKAIKGDPKRYRQDAEKLLTAAESVPKEALVNLLSLEEANEASPALKQILAPIFDRPQFKYSRLFAIGLFTLLEKADREWVKDAKQLDSVLETISKPLSIPYDRLKKDLELYQSNLTKLGQARVIMEEAVQTERKKREQAKTPASSSDSLSDSSPPDSPSETSSETSSERSSKSP